MFYVKHLTHAHFVRGRTDRYNIFNCQPICTAGCSKLVLLDSCPVLSSMFGGYARPVSSALSRDSNSAP